MTRTRLLDRVFLPVAAVDDARSTARAVAPYLGESDGYAVVGHVIEKAGGAMDKASVEQREQTAEQIFDTLGEAFDAAGIDYETHILYGTDVAERIVAAADEYDVDAIAFTPRGGSRWVELLTGNVRRSLLTAADRPVIVLPDDEDDTDG